MKNYSTPRRASGRLVIVSNRLPVSLRMSEEGQWRAVASPGRLVTALAPVLRDRGGLWIGWPGTTEPIDPCEPLAKASREVGYTLRAVPLSREDFNQYYCGFSNEILWLLFHDLQTRCNFDPAYWEAYQAVNRKFAEVVAENVAANDCIWIHDYHMLLVARELRVMGMKNRIAFFQHVPFPPLDVCLKLPWRSQILEGMLDYELVGFQTWRDRNNFVHCVEALVRRLDVDARMKIATIGTNGREVKVGPFPISIDFNEFARQAADRALMQEAERLHRAMKGRRIIFGVDRLDYSKGIPERLRAFGSALERFPDLRGNVSLVQSVSPSRADIPEYRRLKAEIERLVGEINGRFTEPDWVPVHYIYRDLARHELQAYYLAADIALITPLKDGMNLIAKEYCASNVEADGVLILSEFAGAASQLRREALSVNPYDVEGVANAIHQAWTMKKGERQQRMTRLRQSIARRDVFWWVDSFLAEIDVKAVRLSERDKTGTTRFAAGQDIDRSKAVLPASGSVVGDLSITITGAQSEKEGSARTVSMQPSIGSERQSIVWDPAIGLTRETAHGCLLQETWFRNVSDSAPPSAAPIV